MFSQPSRERLGLMVPQVHTGTVARLSGQHTFFIPRSTQHVMP
jgi:hypothetical protein